MDQLYLFSDVQCVYCGHGQASPTNHDLWDGFLDKDTLEHVCTGCKEIHYISKANRMGTLEVKGSQYKITKMTYSEFPVYNRRMQG